jgi:hypothetical protein
MPSEPTHKSQLASKTLPSRPSQTPSLRPLQHSNPSFLKALKNSCHVGVVSQHLLQPLQPQPQFGPQTWLQPQIEQVFATQPQPQPLLQTWLQPQVEQVVGQGVALTDETVNDITKRTASKIPTVFFTICFPIYVHSPNFA